jgi:hypothetical protein
MIAASYGWPWPLEMKDVLARLVALHRERSAEESPTLGDPSTPTAARRSEPRVDGVIPITPFAWRACKRQKRFEGSNPSLSVPPKESGWMTIAATNSASIVQAYRL